MKLRTFQGFGINRGLIFHTAFYDDALRAKTDT